MPKIKSISPSIAKKVVTTKYLAKVQGPRTKRKLDLEGKVTSLTESSQGEVERLLEEVNCN
jgi:hypothetical protein